jgi:hypothetical protein
MVMSMNASVDPGNVMYLSVTLKDGSMERFDNFDDAVAHATALVENGHDERAIFVAMPRARVRMAARVDLVDPPPMPAFEPAGLGPATAERSKDLAPAPEGDVIGEDPDGDRDHRPIGQVEADLDSVASKLRRAQVDYENARAKGDDERIEQYKLQMKAMETEHNRLKKYLSKRLSAAS